MQRQQRSRIKNGTINQQLGQPRERIAGKEEAEQAIKTKQGSCKAEDHTHRIISCNEECTGTSPQFKTC
jgi:hypothetical protein